MAQFSMEIMRLTGSVLRGNQQFFHYLVGILFAAATLLLGGETWATHPTLGPAMFVGITTVLCGWLILSPGLGFGIAGSAFPDANKRRIFQLLSHCVFGLGLYVSALALRPLFG